MPLLLLSYSLLGLANFFVRRHDATVRSARRTSQNTPSETVWKIGRGPEWGPRRPPGGHEGKSIGRLLAAKIYALEASGYFPNSFSTHSAVHRRRSGAAIGGCLPSARCFPATPAGRNEVYNPASPLLISTPGRAPPDRAHPQKGAPVSRFSIISRRAPGAMHPSGHLSPLFAYSTKRNL